jgi:MFS family permease
VPIAFSAAGAVDPHATGRNLARVASVGYVGTVCGPIIIGWLAQATSLRLALGLTVVLALVIAASARAVGSHDRGAPPATTPLLERV